MSERVRVLESVGSLKPTTNPYLALLIGALQARDDVAVKFFSFPAAIFGRWDVFHVHWPEVIFGGHRPIGRLVRRLLATALLARIAITRSPIVRTWHNTDRPSGLSRWDHRLLDGFDHFTGVRIRLNDVTELPADVPVVTVAHGHYRDWFAGRRVSAAIPGRLAFVGLIRRYKGVEDLVSAARGVTHPDFSLHVCGQPSTAELRSAITSLAGADPRISLSFGFLNDDDLVREITEAALIVLPYVHMHNSGTVLAALSLERPVLVPDNAVNRALSQEVGPGWVLVYDGELTSQVISDALARATRKPPMGGPRLDARGWSEGAQLHVDAFRLALRRARA